MRDARRLETRGEVLEIDPAIPLAIAAAVTAGAFWKCVRLMPDRASAWRKPAEFHHARADAELAAAVLRLAGAPGA